MKLQPLTCAIHRRSLPPDINPDTPPEDEELERKSSSDTVHSTRLANLQQLTPFQSASGISFKSQFLYLLVYVTRYLDLFWTFYMPQNLYNTTFKIVFIASSVSVVHCSSAVSSTLKSHVPVCAASAVRAWR